MGKARAGKVEHTDSAIFLLGAALLLRYAFPLFDDPIVMIAEISCQISLCLRITRNRCWESFRKPKLQALLVVG